MAMWLVTSKEVGEGRGGEGLGDTVAVVVVLIAAAVVVFEMVEVVVVVVVDAAAVVRGAPFWRKMSLLVTDATTTALS